MNIIFSYQQKIIGNVKPRRGFTLTEIAIVLGIIGIVLGTIWSTATSVYATQRTNQTNMDILQIMQEVRSLYATAPSTGVTTATDLTSGLITDGAVPTRLVSGTGLKDEWPNGVTAILTPATGDSFTIVMTALPQSACISALTSVGGTSRDAGLFNATAVASAAVATSDAIATTTPLLTPVTPAIATAAAAGNEGGCTGAALYKVQLGFKLH